MMVIVYNVRCLAYWGVWSLQITEIHPTIKNAKKIAKQGLSSNQQRLGSDFFSVWKG